MESEGCCICLRKCLNAHIHMHTPLLCVSVSVPMQVTTHAKTLSQHLRTPESILPVVLSLLKDKHSSSAQPLELRLMGVRMSGLRKVRNVHCLFLEARVPYCLLQVI